MLPLCAQQPKTRYHAYWKFIWNLWNTELLCASSLRAVTIRAAGQIQDHSPSVLLSHHTYCKKYMNDSLWERTAGLSQYLCLTLAIHIPRLFTITGMYTMSDLLDGLQQDELSHSFSAITRWIVCDSCVWTSPICFQWVAGMLCLVEEKQLWCGHPGWTAHLCTCSTVVDEQNMLEVLLHSWNLRS